jgi:hypothetical protein
MTNIACAEVATNTADEFTQPVLRRRRGVQRSTSLLPLDQSQQRLLVAFGMREAMSSSVRVTESTVANVRKSTKRKAPSHPPVSDWLAGPLMLLARTTSAECEGMKTGRAFNAKNTG